MAKKGMYIKIVASFVTLVVISSFTVGFISNSNKEKLNEKMKEKVDIDTIYNNIFINDINMGGLTFETAKEKLNDEVIKPYQDKKITLQYNDKTYEYSYKDFDANYDFDPLINEALNYAREGSLKERYNKIIELDENPLKLSAEPQYSLNNVDTILKDIEPNINIAPVNATMSLKDRKITFTDGKDGLELDKEATKAALTELLKSSEGGIISLSAKVVAPTYRMDDIKDATSLIGSGTSNFSGGGNRVTNMINASTKINEIIVYPGEVFSTNDALGAMTYENGYRESQSIVDGELVPDIGGGVCQVSSTLYNALLQSELEVVERRNHSLKVGYMDYGFDATLFVGSIDLKFKNNTDAPIAIESYMTNNKVYVNIYGKEIHDPTRKLEFKNKFIKQLSPGKDIVTTSSEYAQGARVTKSPAKNGYVYEVYKYVYENGKLVDTVLVNTSNYRPASARIIVGTGAAAPVTEAPATEVPVIEAPATQAPVTQAPTPQTSEPVVSEPVVSEPVVSESVVSEPVAPQVSEPTQPTEPVVTE